MGIVLPQFPVGSVYMPCMPVQLRVFEPRYLNLMGELMSAEKPLFGIPVFPATRRSGAVARGHSVDTIQRHRAKFNVTAARQKTLIFSGFLAHTQ